MQTITVHEPYQTAYTYHLVKPVGKDFDPDFTPDLSPAEMLRLGIFGGNYFSEIPSEFPSEWFQGVTIASDNKAHASYNYFQVLASQPLSEWQKRGWIYPEDPKGWFLWYCRYYMGRRIPDEDARQIKRWKAIRRHIGQLQNACHTGDELCRPRQRQALLHWAYDSRNL